LRIFTPQIRGANHQKNVSLRGNSTDRGPRCWEKIERLLRWHHEKIKSRSGHRQTTKAPNFLGGEKLCRAPGWADQRGYNAAPFEAFVGDSAPLARQKIRRPPTDVETLAAQCTALHAPQSPTIWRRAHFFPLRGPVLPTFRASSAKRRRRQDKMTFEIIARVTLTINILRIWTD